MKFSEELLKEFDLQPEAEKEPVNIMQISEMLEFMETCASRIDRKSQVYQETGDEETRMDCIDIVTAKLNDFTQVFRDLVIFMRKEEGSDQSSGSLRYCVSSYDTFGFKQAQKEQDFLKEMMIRNEITHDYFNRDIHQQKLIWIMENCSAGALDIVKNIEGYCSEAGILEKYARRNA